VDAGWRVGGPGGVRVTFSRIHHVTGARARQRERERGGGEGVPGGHALSLYNVVSFEKFPSRKNSPPETSSVRSLVRLTLPVPRAGEGGARSTPPYVINGGRLLQRGTLALLTGRC
jgi:hypothetical protein